jgi:Raf kinase inhibitor-like YbhB/YbcL family protein
MKNIFTLTLALGLLACTSTPAATIENTIVPTQGQSILPIQTPSVPTEEVLMKFEISSPAFAFGGPIPSKYSCKGSDIPPALAWTEPPAGTQSFALIMDDPDAPAGTWVHWVIFNIPAAARGLAEAAPTDPQLGDGSIQGVTSARANGYHGPCPPSGTHRYFFKLYALDTTLSLTSSADKAKALAAMEGHILANAELMGTFAH